MSIVQFALSNLNCLPLPILVPFPFTFHLLTGFPTPPFHILCPTHSDDDRDSNELRDSCGNVDGGEGRRGQQHGGDGGEGRRRRLWQRQRGDDNDLDNGGNSDLEQEGSHDNGGEGKRCSWRGGRGEGRRAGAGWKRRNLGEAQVKEKEGWSGEERKEEKIGRYRVKNMRGVYVKF